jgi:Domain of Unknown Function with PDB structure (DUF3858)/Transglutaminase-like superfamily
MRYYKCLLFAFCAILFMHRLAAQDKSNYKFGKVSTGDFNLKAEKFDSGANAVIIADIGSTSFEGNNQGFFTLVYTRFIRVKIVNKNGFDIGSREITLYHNGDGDAEKLSALKGSTFNLENGVVTETKLDEKSVFNEKYSKHLDVRKFSLPALKEGSIFDLQYTIKSPFEAELRPWSFQGEYPCLWSEYEVIIAPPFHYVMNIQGDETFDVNTTKEIYGTFSIRESNGAGKDDIYSLSGNSVDKRWVKKNVPALHEEPFTTTLDNYNSRVTFQLNYFQWSPENERHDYMDTWYKTAKTLMQDEDFGLSLSYENNWMSDELKSIVQGSTSEEETTHKIYCYIRDNFKTTNHSGLYTHSTLKDVFKKREGNVAEINLLLTAMLRKAGTKADPVILSTRENGFANTVYPMISEYNYVICVAHLFHKDVTLDASRPYNGFGMLPVACYNGYGRVINEDKPVVIVLSPDSISEASSANVIIINDEKGKSSGAYTGIYGKSNSYDEREEIKTTTLKAYQKKIEQSNSSNMMVDNVSVDSLGQFDFPITVHYDFDLQKLFSADIAYFNPMLNEGYKTNPFKSTARHYPVEIPYKIDEIYLLNMDIPSGYQVDELPKSVRVAYNEKEGLFEYLIQKGDGNLQMRVHLKLNKAFFPVDEYSTLRDFFAFVVKKENEQIVFKKIK